MPISRAILLVGLVVAVDAIALAPTHAPAAAPHERRAWACLLTGNTENMTTLTLVQIASVRRFSTYSTHVTMVTPEVNEVARRQLRAAGSHIVEVGLIAPKWQISASWWSTVFTKLQIFSLGNTSGAGVLDKVAFVDLDAFIVSERADSIFDACGAKELCAVQDAANLCVNEATGEQYVCAMGTPGSSSMLNAGVMVARPSGSLLAAFQAQLATRTKPYLTLPEQEFLSSIYLTGTAVKEPDARRFQFISADYGQCWANSQQLSTASIVHNCGPFKYGHHPLCAWDDVTDKGVTDKAKGAACLERLLGWSEGVERAKEAPRQGVLALYQDLLHTANPCVAHGRTPQTCAAASASASHSFGGASATNAQCTWCGDDVRCVPTTSCLAATPAKTAQAERWQLYLREREWLLQQERARTNGRRGLTANTPPFPPGYVAPPMPPGLAGPPGLHPPTPPALMPAGILLGGPPPTMAAITAASPPPPPKAVDTKAPSPAPPPPPPPSVPPASPGTAYAQRVSTQFVVAGTVETFDSAAFRRALLAIFTDALDITLTVSAASVKVDAAIDFATKSSADAAATTINTTPVATMQSAWFAAAGLNITIENSPAAAVAIVATPTATIAQAIQAQQVAASGGGGLNAGEVFGVVFACLLGFVAIPAGLLVAKRKYNAAKVARPSDLKPRKVRVIPGDATASSTGVAGSGAANSELQQPLVAAQAGVDSPPMAVPLAVKEGSEEVSVVGGVRAPRAVASPGRKGKKGNLSVDIPLAGAAAQGFKVPPLSPQHRAEEKVLEKALSADKAGGAAPGPLDEKEKEDEEKSETSNSSYTDSTAVPSGAPPMAEVHERAKALQPPSRPAPLPPITKPEDKQ